MISRTFYFLLLILTLAFLACNKASPAGFWKNYKKNLIQSHFSDQGPYGGHRAIHWVAKQGNAFTSNDVTDFASKNGWTLVDSFECNHEQTSRWMYMMEPIFPLSHTGFSDSLKNVSTYKHFPRWFGGQIKAYRFKSGWVAIQPGTDDAIEENGFVLINTDRTQIAVYHLWGE